MKKITTIFSCMLLATNFLCFGQNQASKYKIENRFPLDGSGGWDYLTMDNATGRLFISHGMVTQVIDSKTGKLVGTVENTKGVHGIAIDQADNKAFISCGRDSSVSVINLTTLQLITKVKVTGANPDAILYDNFSGNVFVYNGRSANATVINSKTNAVVATIALAGKPEFSATDGNGKVYVNIEDKSLMTVIDSKNLKILNTWPLAPGEEPSGLALDNTTHRLFSVCGNKKMVVMDALNGKIVSTLEIGDGSDGCAFDPGLKRIYSSNGEGTLTVVQEENANKFTVIETLKSEKGARTIGIDTKTHHLYLPTTSSSIPTDKPGVFTILDIAPIGN